MLLLAAFCCKPLASTEPADATCLSQLIFLALRFQLSPALPVHVLPLPMLCLQMPARQTIRREDSRALPHMIHDPARGAGIQPGQHRTPLWRMLLLAAFCCKPLASTEPADATCLSQLIFLAPRLQLSPALPVHVLPLPMRCLQMP